MRPDPEKLNPKIGINVVKFNCTGNMLVTKNGAIFIDLDSQPLILWVWDVAQCKQIAVIQQFSAIKSVAWNPLIPDQLAFSCGTGMVYLWEKGFGCDAVEVPAISFAVTELKWNPDGKSLLLMEKEKFCLSFLVDEDQ